MGSFPETSLLDLFEVAASQAPERCFTKGSPLLATSPSPIQNTLSSEQPSLKTLPRGLGWFCPTRESMERAHFSPSSQKNFRE